MGVLVTTLGAAIECLDRKVAEVNQAHMLWDACSVIVDGDAVGGDVSHSADVTTTQRSGSRGTNLVGLASAIQSFDFDVHMVSACGPRHNRGKCCQ